MAKIYDPDASCRKLISAVSEICESRGISRYALAMKAGISESTFHSLVNGKTSPYLHTVFKICNALEVTVDELLVDELLKDEFLVDECDNQKSRLKEEEKKLIIQYRRMSGEKQAFLRTCADMIEQYQM